MMEVCEKIHFLRQRRKWSQEEMADRLGISVNGYAKIERGETDIPFSRLKQIAKVLEIELAELFNFGEKNVFYVMGNTNNNQFVSSNIQHPSTDSSEEKTQFQLEKLYLIVQQQSKEIEYLKEIIQFFISVR